MLKKILALAVLACAFVTTFAEEQEQVLFETTLEDGSINQWTKKDAVDAAELLNRKYHRDMKTHSGRSWWHGEAKSFVNTNECINVTVYEDGYAVTSKWQRVESVIEKNQRIEESKERRRKALEKRAETLPSSVAEIFKARLENELAIEDGKKDQITIDVTTGKELK